MSSPSPVLIGENIRREFVMGSERLTVLDKVSLTVHAGEIVAILGPSGSGKSTLLHILAGLDYPTEGEVKIDGVKLSSIAQDRLPMFRNRNVGLVFQFHHLLPEFTVLENVMMPRLIAGEMASSAREKALTTLSEIGFGHRLRHHPAELSGGEKQKVATARALVTEPKIVMADEPTGNLDSHSAQNLTSLFKELNQRKGVTFLLVSHNERLAAIAHRRLVLEEGGLREQ